MRALSSMGLLVLSALSLFACSHEANQPALTEGHACLLGVESSTCAAGLWCRGVEPQKLARYAWGKSAPLGACTKERQIGDDCQGPGGTPLQCAIGLQCASPDGKTDWKCRTRENAAALSKSVKWQQASVREASYTTARTPEKP